LGERECRVDKDHDENGDSELRHSGEEGKETGNPQHEREELDQLIDELTPEWSAARGRYPIGTVKG
jgi:hypothetical protein